MIRVLPGPPGGSRWVTLYGRSLLLDPRAFDGDDLHPSLVGQVVAALGGVDDVYRATVLTSQDCNLTCGYCFQNTIQTDSLGRPVRQSVTTMTHDVAAAAAQFIRSMAERAGRERIDVMLFGGEPLMNPDVCESLLRGVGETLDSAQLVTNATLLSVNTASRLVAAGLRHIQVSFDGDRGVHDAVRKNRAGRGTFDLIVGNIDRVSRAHPELTWNIRVNVARQNLDGLQRVVDSVRFLPERSVVARFTVALLDDVGLGFEGALTTDDAVASQIIEANRAAIDAGFEVIPTSNLASCPYCSQRDGATGCVIDADGSLYSSWESSGRDGYRVGHIDTGYDRYPSQRWVRCDFDVSPHGDPASVRRFWDRIDVAALDHQHARQASSQP